MGTTATGQQQGRARAREARIERRIARRDAATPAGVERRGRIKAAVASARTALRVRAAAEQAGAEAETRAAAAVRRVLDVGLSQADAAVLLGLSRSAVVRLARRAPVSTGAGDPERSTADTTDPASARAGADGETSSAATSGATSEGDC